MRPGKAKPENRSQERAAAPEGATGQDKGKEGDEVTTPSAAGGLMKVKEVAERLSCGPSQVYALVQAGRLRAYRLSARTGGQGALRVSEAQLAAFLADAETGAGPFEAGDLEHLR
jgi:excisionase family DNA binding protein